MRNTIEKMLASLREYIAKLSRKTKIQLGVLSLVIITLAVLATVLLTQTNWVTLSGTGDAAATARIHQALLDEGFNVRVDNTRMMVQVPEQDVGRISMWLQDQGLTGPQGIDGSIIEGATGFGVTEAHARDLRQMQTAEWLRIQILQTHQVTNAIVIVNFGETSPFRVQQNLRPPQASVMLTVAGGNMLNQSEAQSIAELVMGAVPGIEYQNIRITDSNLNTYQIGDQAESADIEFANRLLLENQLRNQYRGQVMQLLSSIFGPNNLQVEPYVRLNFDRVTREEVEYSPPIAGNEGGIIRSIEEIRERSRSWADAMGVPGTDSNAMGSTEYPWGEFGEDDLFMRDVVNRNYEINETRRFIEQAQGFVEAQSIAIIINSEIEGIEEDFSSAVIEAVSAATGIVPASVSVQSMPFAFEDTEAAEMFARWEEAQAAENTRRIIETIIMYAVIALMGLMVFLLGRTIVKALQPEPIVEPALVTAGAGGEGINYLISDSDETASTAYEDIDISTKSPGLEQVERFIDKDPGSVAQLLRNWLSDDLG